MKRLLLAAIAVAGFASSQAAIVVVHVFHSDYSTNPMGQPIVDPVINTGDTIRWQFDHDGHSATSVTGIPEQWNSGFVGMGGTFDHTFNSVGVWEYYCLNHGFDNGNGTAGGMAGKVTVVPEPATLLISGFGLIAIYWRRRLTSKA